MANCYYCNEFKKISVSLAEGVNFCNEEEHELWANKHYGPAHNARETRDIKDIQKSLLKFAETAPTEYELKHGIKKQISLF